MAEKAHKLHFFIWLFKIFWLTVFFFFIQPSFSCMQAWINSKEAFNPLCGFSQSSRHNRVAKVGMDHKPSNLAELVCLDAHLLQKYIFMLSEIILKCQSVLFITYLRKNNGRDSTLTAFVRFDCSRCFSVSHVFVSFSLVFYLVLN